jgi:hypothetical protein
MSGHEFELEQCEIKFDSIESLDPKYSINFLDSSLSTTNCSINTTIPEKYPIIVVDNFMTKSECKEIISSVNSYDLTELSFRDSKRIIAFDNNDCLTNTISSRLEKNGILNKINNIKIKPYGFSSNSVNWNPNNSQINKCFRFNKYTDSEGVKYHRDAQYCESKFVKSNYTLVLYLNNDYVGGEIKFKIPNVKIDHCGHTIKEELNLLQSCDSKKITISPRRGTLVIFDQRLLHKTSNVKGTKYILRSELICTGTKNSHEDTDLEKKIEILTKKLFRQAQYFELKLQEIDSSKTTFNQLNNKCSDLYEICLNLRQNPSSIKKYPKKLELLLENLPESAKIGNCLNLIRRNGSGCVFNYAGNNKLELIKISALFSFISCTQKITNTNSSKIFKNILNMLGIVSHNKISDSVIEEVSDNVADVLSKNDDLHNEKFFESEIIYEKYHDKYDYLKYFDINTMNNKTNKNNNFALQFSCEETSFLSIECGCSLGDNIKLMDKICKFRRDDSFKLNKKEFEFKISDVSINEDLFTGKLSFDTIVDSFNHASCQCEGFVVPCGDTVRKYKTIKVNIEFQMDDTTIKIDLCPGIAM